MSRKKYLIINAILALVVLVGGTYAFYEWQSSTNTDITLSVEGLKVLFNGGTNITGTTIIPTATKDEGISKVIEVQLDSNKVITPTPTMNLYLELTTFSSLLKDPSLKWELYKGNDLLNNGSFNNNNEGDVITLASNQNVTSTKDTYTLYIWIDGNMDNNPAMQEQPFTFNLNATGSNALVSELVEIDGILFKSDGTPCSECDLTFHSDPITTTTNTDGAYHVTNVPTGTHNIIVSKDNVELLNDNIEIVSGNSLTYSNKVVTTNINKFYMNIKPTNENTIQSIVTSTTEIKEPMTDTIIALATTNTNELWTITQPATTQVAHQVTDYRYYGASPNNYVYYNCKDTDNNGVEYGEAGYNYSIDNCEKWRVIGVFETETPVYTNETITSYITENRVKIIREESIGNYSFDSSSSNINGGWGINAWQQADLMTTLNGIYMTKGSGTCYNGQNNATIPCDFSTTGLSETAKTLVEPAKYYLGGTEWKQVTSVNYAGERETTYKSCTSGTYCNDTYTRQGTWTGYVGLMYGSDYGYAAGSTCANETILYYYNSNCKDTDWLYSLNITQWALSPAIDASSATDVFRVYSNGDLGIGRTYGAYAVRPVVYLSSDVVIKDGQGTSNSPWIINK